MVVRLSSPRRGSYTELCVVTIPWIAFSIRLACGAVMNKLTLRRGGDGGELVVQDGLPLLLGLLLLGLLILLGDLLI